MDKEPMDLNQMLILDGNAAAGLLEEIFAAEMTASPTECAHCGRQGEVATLVAFTYSPGLVLRCPACENVMIRIVETPEAVYIDARGAAYLRLERRAS
ncbi:MAG TPA: DUF6510 family protein [Anaerolineales bacterium]|nr:DUF6510 family protein [Anaerolineales bacterium]